MASFYKFLETQHLASLLRGTFRFGRLRYYRLLEACTGDRTIGDLYEATASTALPEVERPGVVIKDNVSIRQVDAFVLCLSAGEISKLRPIMCTSIDGGRPYDACVEFPDPQALAKEIFSKGQLENGDLVSDLFDPIEPGPVIYDARPMEVWPPGSAEPSVLHKQKWYEPQSEFRIALLPKRAIDRDFIFINAESAGTTGVTAFRNSETCVEATPEGPSILSAHVQTLRDCCQSIDRRHIGSGRRPMDKVLDVEIFLRDERLQAGRAYWALRQAGHGDARLDSFFLFASTVSNVMTLCTWVARLSLLFTSYEANLNLSPKAR